MKLKQTTIFTSMMAIPALLAVSSAQATPVTGMANIAGNVSVSATTISFVTAANPTGSFSTSAGAMETGSFSGLTGGTVNQNLANGPTTGNIPPVVDFITFSSGVASPVFFDLNFIAPGVGTAAGCGSSALGAECTPPGSPFTLIQLTSNTIVASLQLNGVSYTGSSASGTSPTTSIFTTQTAVNGTIPQVIAILQSGGTLTGITYSASFTTSNAVPEPASMALMGIGLVGAGLIARRRFVK